MSDVTADLRRLLERAVERPWRVGFPGGHNANIIIRPTGLPSPDDAEAVAQVYGIPIHCTVAEVEGFGRRELKCLRTSQLIVGAVNALPALLDVAEAAEACVSVGTLDGAEGDRLDAKLAALSAPQAAATSTVSTTAPGVPTRHAQGHTEQGE